MSPAPGTAHTPALGLRERKKAARRARILEAAQARLASEGYESMTMAQIAHDADVAVGTVFQYAATKAELLMMATAARWTGTLPLLVHAPRPADPVAAVRALIDPVVRTALDEPENSSAIARELLFGEPGPHRDELRALVRRLEDAIAAAIAHPREPDERDSAAAGLVVAGALLELHRRRTAATDTDDIEDRLERMIALFVAG